jgi:hypothetical protein
MAEMLPAVVAAPIARLLREVVQAADKMAAVAQEDMEQQLEAPMEIVAPPTPTLLEEEGLPHPMVADASVLGVVAALPRMAAAAVVAAAGTAVAVVVETGPPAEVAVLPTPAP